MRLEREKDCVRWRREGERKRLRERDSGFGRSWYRPEMFARMLRYQMESGGREIRCDGELKRERD